MEHQGQQLTFIDLDDRNSWRSGVLIAIVVVLLFALVVAPPILRDMTAHADVSRVGAPVERDTSPALCVPSFDVPHLLDPVARVVLPGWTQLCRWIVDSDIAAPFDPSG